MVGWVVGRFPAGRGPPRVCDDDADVDDDGDACVDDPDVLTEVMMMMIMLISPMARMIITTSWLCEAKRIGFLSCLMASLASRHDKHTCSSSAFFRGASNVRCKDARTPNVYVR